MRFGNVEIDPACNPAVLDTVTWDPVRVRQILNSVEVGFWRGVRQATAQGHSPPGHERCTVYRGSYSRQGKNLYSLARLSDGQHVFVGIEAGDGAGTLGEPIQTISLNDTERLAAYVANSTSIRSYIRVMRPDKRPRAMGAVPRLGIGTRMSTAVWPGVWRAMDEGRFYANAIQNSVRELNLLEDVLAARPSRSNYLYGFGTLEEGHTGSTFEGLWTAGVIEALKADTHPTYGADADHITVRRGPGGMERAKRVIEAARDYTFFTLDVSDVVNYGTAPALGEDAERIRDKYREALDVVRELCSHIRRLKGDAPFDLELSIDECPPGKSPAACLTTEAELTFLIEELQQRGIAVTHVAPNVGIVKGQDYEDAGGLAEFEGRIGRLHDIACERGVILDFHSGDDLCPAVRQAIGRATQGWNHFKVSPSLQVIFGEVLHETHPDRFRPWWDDTLAYARWEAAAGSDFAVQCVRQYEQSEDPAPSPHHAVFHHYNFAAVGRRDANGQFISRERFYDLPTEFYLAYHDRVRRFLCDVAADVFCYR